MIKKISSCNFLQQNATRFGFILLFYQKTENEWEKLLKPFDLKALRQPFNRIAPARLCKLLQLPLDTQSECSFSIGQVPKRATAIPLYHTLITKLDEAREFKMIEQLLQQSKDEGVVLREALFIL